MKKRDRIASAIAGAPVDQVPVSAWGHFFLDEVEPVRFADRMVSFQQEYDWDFLKVHARASYHVEPFGFRYQPSRSMDKGHTLAHTPIRTPDDWLNLRPAPLNAPVFEEQLAALALIRRQVPDDVPIIMTVFTPLDIAEKMLDRNSVQLMEHITTAPEAVDHALSVFAETLGSFVARVVELGVDGVFFSTKWANGTRLTSQQYRDLCLRHDLQMMNPAASLPFNILHVCENDILLDTFADYPVSVVNWDDSATHNPDLPTGKNMTGRAVSGGINHLTFAKDTASEVTAKGVNAIIANNGTGMILTPGCSVQMATTPKENFHALRAAPEHAARQLEAAGAL